ncbi:MAG: hypothetical protein AB7P20_11405 [Rhizobiaceae bacterium]
MAGWCAFLGALTYLGWTDFALLSRDRWCTQSDPNCLREWIAALSGWVAALAAAAAIAPLIGQLKAQQKQTAFALGEGMPTVTASHPEGKLEEFALRIVNWNRLAVDVLRVRILDSTHPVRMGLSEVEIDGHPKHMDIFQEIKGILRIRGWENRSDGPSICQLLGFLAWDEEPGTVIGLHFGVDLFIPEDVPRVVTVSARMNIAVNYD